jgi:hypothetical protein
MRKVLLLALFLVVSSNFMVKGQSNWSNYYKSKRGNIEFGMLGGISFYVGDIVTSPLAFVNWRPCGGANIRFGKSKWWNIRTSLVYANVAGDDALSTSAYRHERNLSFKSSIIEGSVTGEVNLLGYEPVATKKKFTPYAFAGIAVFHFNPKALYQGTWYDLQPLGTEGQGIPGYGQKYSLTQISIPIGGGLKFGFKLSDGNYIAVSGEIGVRKTFTDYLDDVSNQYLDLKLLEKYNGVKSAELSVRTDEYFGYPVGNNFDVTRGSPKSKDYYFVSGVTIAYIFYQRKQRINFYN